MSPKGNNVSEVDKIQVDSYEGGICNVFVMRFPMTAMLE